MKMASAQRGRAWVGVVLVGAMFATLGSCNHEPIKGLERSFTLKVEKRSGTGKPIPIDFLWVVDNSSSMCQEQLSLADSFETFTTQIEAFFQIDPRLAVTSHDVQCAIDNTNVFSSKGVFNTIPATAFPPPCQERRTRRCFADSACANMDCVIRGECDADDTTCTCDGPQGEWTCRHPNTESCVENPNGTINSECTRHCTTDEECQVLFGDTTYVCQKPSNNQADWGCIRPPATSTCPTTVPAVLDATNIDLFPCAATVGVNQEKCFKYEQGMNAALMAIDPTGPNAEQARGFLRDDAYLVIIFISDEDDCSVAAGRSINEDDYDTCALLPTTDQGGPLVPVGHFINRFKSLKQDPGKVIVAAIGGDSISEDPAEVAADRAAYNSSKADPKVCFHQSFICLSDNGKADFGSRYLELTESFGPNGKFTNICKDEGIAPSLDAIAETILTVLNQICLPKVILDPDQLVVKRVRAGVETILTIGDGPNSYRIIPTAEACSLDGQALPAIAFGDPPSPGEEITITYQGDPFPQ
ncbi:MAG: hypothetical protein CVU56_10325 [Deltaproteobacteria bacterium HGW-Deltaproteobacteria-14]|jgi:antitoxin (DNA-binding transcriptional repressor) of toxin-antitoxin stability system|nr:MAG: hypothetical protein CVU56_10325 [Deltaproteobacteria bacterium HGW-Deltaproteobacteria-14]